MKSIRIFFFHLIIVLDLLLAGMHFVFAQETTEHRDESRQRIELKLQDLKKEMLSLNESTSNSHSDVAIFVKGIEWALRYDAEFTPKDLKIIDRALKQGAERIASLRTGSSPWKTKTGKVAMGYVSQVDSSVQPFGLIVPSHYDPTKPTRLDVVLHGSSVPVGMSELRFMDRFLDDADSASSEHSFLELHPLGRVENCYRWAGETDVWESIEEVCRRYNVDRKRIVLRGMSMGASGTWHLGLKHPDRFAAIGPYCGYVDTHRFSETPLPTFVKVGVLPEHQELGLHMLDSVDYAANARMVPSIACMGEKDIFKQAHEIMGEAMQMEGLTMVNLISPGTGHVIDPVTQAEQMRRIGEIVERGLDTQPSQIKFTTWTLKYSRCHWLQVLGLKQHYVRADITANLSADGIAISDVKNIDRFAVMTQALSTIPKWVKIEDAVFDLKESDTPDSPQIVFVLKDGKWSIEEDGSYELSVGKRPGLQGPIDDAFTSSFLCVRGTGKAWNTNAQNYADASLARFAAEWARFFRGDLPIKKDSEVTEEDLRTRNLILFGDPGSNYWIAKMLPDLPLEWSATSLRIGGQEYSASSHVPALIAPNPLDDSRRHYAVLNSGHTFHEAELGKLNYLLFPRWGDWAVLEIGLISDVGPLVEKVSQAGYFDERWRSIE